MATNDSISAVNPRPERVVDSAKVWTTLITNTDYLSGLLIGSEIVAALAQAPAELPLVLVGEPALCQRYAAALEALQRAPTALLGNTAPDGLWALAHAAGLVAP